MGVPFLNRYLLPGTILQRAEGHHQRERYRKRDPEQEYQIILNLRTNEGLDLLSYKDKYGVDLYLEHQSDIDEMIQKGYLLINNNHLIATYEGMMTLDQIILVLI